MSYDMIDRFLRNNLGDEDYAEYSAALDAAYTPQRKPLTDDEIEALWDSTLSEDVGITTLRKITRAIQAAHGIGEKK